MRATGPVQDVIQRLTSGRRIRITVLGQSDEAVALLKSKPSIRDASHTNGVIEAQYDGDDATAAGILQSLIAAGIKVSSFTQLEGGLEDAFMKATSEDIG
jgi:ABC-2 type transport system ATP-binding protein